MGGSFHIEHFGCRAARADGEAIADRLRAGGLREGRADEADVVVVNTCSVTAEADREARAFIRRAHRLNPTARIVATGCYAQRAPKELAGLDGVAAVVGNSHKAFAPEIALGLGDHCRSQSALVPVAALLAGHADGGDCPQGLKPLIHDEAVDVRAEARTIQAEARTIQAVTDTLHADARARRGETDSLHAEAQTLPDEDRALQAEARALHFEAGTLETGAGILSHAPLILVDDRFAHSFLEEAQVVPGSQTRPNLKIQEGCGNRCTFCVIPQTRGSSRSLLADKVLSQVRGFIDAGGKELVLSGINLGRWGRDVKVPSSGGPTSLAALVHTILEETELPRVRLSSIEPMDWDGRLIALMAEFGGNRLARHAHCPLQSGSDAVLRRMHRRYRPWHYAEKVTGLIGAVGEELTLGADVMVGFPGETDHEFVETVEFIRSMPFGYLHLFPFSPRPGTRGWALHAEDPVPSDVVEERMAVLRSLAAEKSRAHRERFVGRALDAITLHTPTEIARLGRSSALTENFLPVEIDGELPANELVRVWVKSLSGAGVLAGSAEAPADSPKPACVGV